MPWRSAQPITLSNRVVAADVFADDDQLALGCEEAGGVQAAGAVEGRLARPLGEVGEQSRVDSGPGGRERGHRDLLERALSAHAAGLES